MYAIDHLNSSQEVSTFKSKPITFIVVEDESDLELADAMKAVLEERMLEEESTYLSSDESINQLNKKYGL